MLIGKKMTEEMRSREGVEERCFLQGEDGIQGVRGSRGIGEVYKGQGVY